MTIGADRPPYGARHRKFWPFIVHVSGNPVSVDTPSRLGPRASGQSPRATRRGESAAASMPALTTSAITSVECFIVIQLCLSPLSSRPFASDAPHVLRVETSVDGARWATAWANLTVSQALRAALADPRRIPLVISFPPAPARYVRLTQTGDNWEWYWSIAELQVLAQGEL